MQSKSKIIIAAVIVIVAVAGLVFVNQQQAATITTTMASTSGVPVPNPGQLIEETSDQPSTGYDPALEWGNRGNIVMENVYETLVTYNGSQPDKFIPWLAQSWDVSPDGLTYTFHLRQGITFQDGTAFNATAVKYSLDRAILIHADGGPEYLLSDNATMAVKGAPRYWNAETDNNYNSTEAQAYLAAGGVTVIDPYTVQVTLTHPYAATIATFAFTVTSIVSPSYVIAHCQGSPEMPGVMPGKTCDNMSNQPLGSGPYMVTEFTPKVRTVLTSYDGYWGGPNHLGPAKIKTYVINYVPEISTRELDLFAGTTDAIDIQAANAFDIMDKTAWTGSQTVTPLKPGIRIWVKPTLQLVYMMINPRNPPFNNIYFRKALAYAFPYDTFINQAQNGFATRLYGPIPPGIPGYDPSLNGYYDYSPQIARQLFQQAGYNGTAIISVRTGDANLATAALLLKDSVQSIYPGVTIQIQQVDTPTWSNLFRNFGTPLDIGAWTWDIDDPADFLPFAVTPGGQVGRFTEFGYNSTLVNWANQAAGELDQGKRNQLYSLLQHAVMASGSIIPMDRPTAIFAERDWVQPGNSTVGRAIDNPMWGDGDGGFTGGYHPYYLWKAQFTQQVNVMIGPPIFIAATVLFPNKIHN